MPASTPPHFSRTILATCAALLMTVSLAHAQGAAKSQPTLSPELAQARTALDKYQDPMVAVADGYLSTVACIDFPQGHHDGEMQYVAGGMGVHFLNLGNIGPTMDPMKPQVLIYEPDGDKLKPRWPAGPLRLRFEPVIRAYYASCKVLSMRLLSAIALNLGVSGEHLARGFDDAHTSFLRLNYYPKYPLGLRDDRPLGVGEHTDAGALTLLLQDRQPGLEVRRDDRWYLVEPRADALVVNIGDIVQVWSNDRYRAALHRVITNTAADRYSLPFFLNPSWETSYEPLPTTVTAHEPAHYRRIHWREFRALRAAGDYADIGEEVQISHYRQ